MTSTEEDVLQIKNDLYVARGACGSTLGAELRSMMGHIGEHPEWKNSHLLASNIVAFLHVHAQFIYPDLGLMFIK